VRKETWGVNTSIRAFPEPTILSILYGFQEIFADNIGLIRYFLTAMLPSNNILKLCIIPTLHAVLIIFFPDICVYVFLGCFTFNGYIVREFAFVASLTLSLFKVYTPTRN